MSLQNNCLKWYCVVDRNKSGPSKPVLQLWIDKRSAPLDWHESRKVKFVICCLIKHKRRHEHAKQLPQMILRSRREQVWLQPAHPRRQGIAMKWLQWNIPGHPSRELLAKYHTNLWNADFCWFLISQQNGQPLDLVTFTWGSNVFMLRKLHKGVAYKAKLSPKG